MVKKEVKEKARKKVKERSKLILKLIKVLKIYNSSSLTIILNKD